MKGNLFFDKSQTLQGGIIMGKQKFGKKVLAGIMSLALAASVLPAGVALQKAQVAKAEGGTPAAVDHFYDDYKHESKATDASLVAYVNGGKDKKSDVVYTDMAPSYYYVNTTPDPNNKNAKGKFTSATSKVLVAVSTSNSSNPINKGKVDSKATEVRDAQKIAKATIKDGIITVTAQKNAGKVYVWVADSCTGNSAKISATIKTAPKKINLYSKAMTDEQVNASTQPATYTKGDINIGASKDVCLYAYNEADKKKTQVKQDITFEASVDAKAKEYFTVTQKEKDATSFTIKAIKLGTGDKAVTGTITFTCKESGAKTTFKATAVDGVSSFTYTEADPIKAAKQTDKGVTKGYTVASVKAAKADTVGEIATKIVSVNDKAQGGESTPSNKTTDKIMLTKVSKDTADKIIAAKEASKTVVDATGKLLKDYPKATSTDAKGITVTRDAKTGALKVKVTKGTADETKAYFVLSASSGVAEIITVATDKAPEATATP